MDRRFRLWTDISPVAETAPLPNFFFFASTRLRRLLISGLETDLLKKLQRRRCRGVGEDFEPWA